MTVSSAALSGVVSSQPSAPNLLSVSFTTLSFTYRQLYSHFYWQLYSHFTGAVPARAGGTMARMMSPFCEAASRHPTALVAF